MFLSLNRPNPQNLIIITSDSGRSVCHLRGIGQLTLGLWVPPVSLKLWCAAVSAVYCAL